MAYARIEDMDGFAEVIIFPDTYKASSDILAEDKPVIIIGSINKSDAGFKIKSSKIQDLLTAPVKKDTRVDIRLHSVGLTQDDLKALKGILKEHSGAYPVYIHIISNQKEYILALDNSMRINPSNNLITAVETRFGKNSILFN